MAKGKVDGSLLAGLGLTQIEILNSVAKLQRSDLAYGFQIARDLSQARGGDPFNQAQVFVTLKRLVERGLVVQDGLKVEQGSPVMKLYKLTSKGNDTLRAWRARFEPALEDDSNKSGRRR